MNSSNVKTAQVFLCHSENDNSKSMFHNCFCIIQNKLTLNQMYRGFVQNCIIHVIIIKCKWTSIYLTSMF